MTNKIDFPLVSVVFTSYNHDEFLEQAQTWLALMEGSRRRKANQENYNENVLITRGGPGSRGGRRGGGPGSRGGRGGRGRAIATHVLADDDDESDESNNSDVDSEGG